ncbi:hypothetical protein [Actinoplanes sp. NPDC026619]|uniref:hypothetical protein n=1 Tax=Actinoplanes sp. NPDC026619 TaxID=3155798 RepID=UPI0033C4416C
MPPVRTDSDSSYAEPESESESESESDESDSDASDSDESDSDTSDSDSSADEESTSEAYGVYRGALKITVRALDGCTNQAYENSYRYAATLVVRQGPGSSPHVYLATNSQSSAGTRPLGTGISGTDTRDGREVNVRFFDTSYADGEIEGELINNGTSAGLAYNGLNFPRKFGCGPAAFATPYTDGLGEASISGEVTEDSADLTFKGGVTQNDRAFAGRFTA